MNKKHNAINFKSALITGGTGFIGTALINRLIQEKIKVYSIVRFNSNREETQKKDVNYIFVESFKEDELKKKLAGLDVDMVFNLASYGVNPKDRDSHEMVTGNINVLSNLLLSLQKSSLNRFIHIGSCSEYGAPEKTAQSIDEDQRLHPQSLYGAAKAAAYIYGNTLAKILDIPFVALRLFGVYGIGERPYRLIPYIINKLMKNEPVDLTGGEQVRDFLYIEDVIGAIITAAVSKKIIFYQPYNVCSGQGIKIREVGHMVAENMGKSEDLLLWGERPYRIDEPMWLVGNNQRFIQATDWYPSINLKEGINRMVLHELGRGVD